MGIRMTGIVDLYRDMKQTGKLREHFNFTFRNVGFEVIFLIDREPFELLVGVLGYNVAFTALMEPGFFVGWIPNDILKDLRKILHLRGESKPFTSDDFWAIVQRCAPHCCAAHTVQPHQIARYKAEELQALNEKNKTNFVGWNDHSVDQRKARNFKKTAVLLGPNVADYCRKNNISSIWSEFPRDRRSYREPWN